MERLDYVEWNGRKGVVMARGATHAVIFVDCVQVQLRYTEEGWKDTVLALPVTTRPFRSLESGDPAYVIDYGELFYGYATGNGGFVATHHWEDHLFTVLGSFAQVHYDLPLIPLWVFVENRFVLEDIAAAWKDFISAEIILRRTPQKLSKLLNKDRITELFTDAIKELAEKPYKDS